MTRKFDGRASWPTLRAVPPQADPPIGRYPDPITLGERPLRWILPSNWEVIRGGIRGESEDVHDGWILDCHLEPADVVRYEGGEWAYAAYHPRIAYLMQERADAAERRRRSEEDLALVRSMFVPVPVHTTAPERHTQVYFAWGLVVVSAFPLLAAGACGTWLVFAICAGIYHVTRRD